MTKKELLRALKENSALIPFVNNFLSEDSVSWRKRVYGDSVKDFDNFLFYSKSILDKSPLLHAFVWDMTKEGYEFWFKINNMIERYEDMEFKKMNGRKWN